MNIFKKLFNPKYRFFARKIKSVTKQIWDYEFKVEKTMQVKEGIRQDRDRMLDAKHKVEVALKATPDDKNLMSEFEKIVDTIKRYELQMNMLDKQIDGVPAQGDNPGEEGVADIISSLAELRSMYKAYLSKL